MTKKTRRKLPPGQRPRHGAALGYEDHGSGCRCRQCRQLAALGRDRSPDRAVRKTFSSLSYPALNTDLDPDVLLAEVARDVRLAMQGLTSAIDCVAAAGGQLLGLIDNRNGTETLSSIQADQGYQLMKGLNDAHIALIDFWLEVGKGLS